MQLSNYGSFPASLPIIIEDEIFLYPFMIAPLFLSDEKMIKAASFAVENNSLILVCHSKNGMEGDNTFDSIYESGVIGSIIRKIVLPDGRVKVLFQGLARGHIVERLSDNPLLAIVDTIKTHPYNEQRVEAVLANLREHVKSLSAVAGYFPPDLLKTINENHEPNRIADLISSSMKLQKDDAHLLFIEQDVEKRLMKLIEHIIDETEGAKLQKEIRAKVHDKMDKVNKEYFLKEQLKQIRKELGEDTSRQEELEEYGKRLEAIKPFMYEDAYKEAKKQLDKLGRMHPDSGDANVLQTYIEYVLELPYGKVSKAKLEVAKVAKTLDEDHFSLEKPKRRIVEFFAVKELLELRGTKNKDAKGAILCFIGPPGVGKTSLANSIAKALKRELVRVALGGLEDVNELRGHRRTYVGAMPGRLIQGLINAKQMNPVVVLDEIDKVGRSMRGDPTAALLEILDPEQNDKFRDYYLNFNIDLSNAVFIATANDASTIPAPLRDRMEFIEVSSYTPQEKYEIAKKYLLPQELKKHGLKPNELSMPTAVLKEVIEKYTREAGVRSLRRQIAAIARKSAKIILEEKVQKVSITSKNLKDFLDKTVFEYEEVDKKNQIGVVNGLAWTAVGGDVLKIEAVKIKGKGGVEMTGSLGDVMKESAKIAYSVVKTLIDGGKLKIDKKIIDAVCIADEKGNRPSLYDCYNLHIHVPDGATPKDGPSAGIAMATVISSILSERKVNSSVAMTGEITLTGKVTAIGGLKEKLIAAYKSQIKTALIPQKNYDRDLPDIPDEVKENMQIIPVKTIDEVLKYALEAK
ncbi:MAG: endopeptidase La [Campylobacterales bacterium]